MTTDQISKKTERAWNNSVEKVLKKIDFLFNLQLNHVPNNLQNNFEQSTSKIGELYSAKKDNYFSINVFKDSQTLYNTLKVSIISEWAYHNLSNYALNGVSISELCNNAHENQQNHERISNRIYKSCKHLMSPNSNDKDYWHSLFSKINNISENSMINSVYSYNTTYNLIFNWNHLLNLIHNDETLDLSQGIDALLNTISANIQKVSGSKTGLGNFAPEYIIQQLNEELFDPYFFLELVYRLINLKRNIESQITSDIINAYETSIQNLTDLYSSSNTQEQSPDNFCSEEEIIDNYQNTENYKQILKPYVYRYDFLQITYFIFLCTSIPIGKCHSHHMKYFYLECLTKQFLDQADLLFSATSQTSTKPSASLHYFETQISICNTIYRAIYRYFSAEMHSLVSEIDRCLIDDISLFNNYFSDISNYSEKIYNKTQRLLSSTYYTEDVTTLIKDLLEIKSNNYNCIDDWQTYYQNHSINEYVLRVMSTTSIESFKQNPIANHFVPIDELFKSSYKKSKKLSLLIKQYDLLNKNTHIVHGSTKDSSE